jgi:hypothetical protein
MTVKPSDWMPDVHNEHNMKNSLLTLVASVLLGLIVIWQLLVAQETKLEKMPSLQEAKAIFAIIHKPSQELISQLSDAYQKGVKVQLITEKEIEGESFPIKVVPSDKINRDGILIDGTQWYYLP